MSEQRLTDLSYLEDMGIGDNNLLIELIELFLENTPESIRLLRHHYNEGNWQKLAAEAHKMKPTLSYMGLNNAWDLTEQIEKAAKEKKDPDNIPSKIDQIESTCKKSYIELEEKLTELKN